MENKEKMQHTFDVIAAHLLTQNAQSLNAGGQCAYRGENGLRCAVGFCISDEKYDPSIEGFGVTLRTKGYIDDQFYKGGFFLSDIQKVHDNIPVTEWEEGLIAFAIKYNLDYAVVQATLQAKLPSPTLVSQPENA